MQHLPPPPPPPPSAPTQSSTSSLPQLHHRHTVPQSQQNFQHISQSVQSHTRDDKRREFRETASRWSEPKSSTSRHRNDQNLDYSAKRRPYEAKIDTSKEAHRDRNKDKDRRREKGRDSECSRSSSSVKTVDRVSVKRHDRRTHSRDSYKVSRSRSRSRSRSTYAADTGVKKDDRVSMKRDDRRTHAHDSHKESRNRNSRSRSRSTYSTSGVETTRNRPRNSTSFAKHNKSDSYDANRRSTPSASLSKAELLLPPSKPLTVKHIEDKRQKSVERISQSSDGAKTERARILEKWRSNYCETSEDITRKLEELAENIEKECWIRSSPADLFYKRTSVNEIEGTARLDAICTLFKSELVDRGPRVRKSMPALEAPPKKRLQRVCRHKSKRPHTQNKPFPSSIRFTFDVLMSLCVFFFFLIFIL